MMQKRNALLSAVAAAALALAAVPASAQQILVLAEDVPAGLDYDGPSAAIPASQQGMVTLLEPLVGYAAGPANEDGIGMPDFSKIEGRLVESWDYDPATLTWTLHLRKGVKGC